MPIRANDVPLFRPGHSRNVWVPLVGALNDTPIGSRPEVSLDDLRLGAEDVSVFPVWFSFIRAEPLCWPVNWYPLWIHIILIIPTQAVKTLRPTTFQIDRHSLHTCRSIHTVTRKGVLSHSGYVSRT